MDANYIIGAGLAYLASIGVAYFIASNRADKKIGQYSSIKEAIEAVKTEHNQAKAGLSKMIDNLNKAREVYKKIDTETKDLQQLRKNAGNIAKQLMSDQIDLQKLQTIIAENKQTAEEGKANLHDVMSKLDLYTRLDEFVEYGHFEFPEYLYETGERFAAEIKILREKQKSMIKDGSAFTQEGTVSLTGDSRIDKKIIDGQMKMIIRAFNIECDLLIAKVGPSNLDRSLSRIEKLANDLEKLVASLRCGISLDYVTLKYEECAMQYQYMLKKKEEQEEQKLIKEQMREEARAEKEYKAALAAAEKEEKLYRDLLEKARKELELATSGERAITEAKVAQLEQQLAEAEAKEERAKSMAEQTRRGHVYIISNVGSFGENVYKIGMTRRLDPLDRVKELGDASVPFKFDVHAMIFSEDAPALETALHRKFGSHRVNAVNLRKEFFRVDLEKIQEAAEEIGGDEIDFRTTIAAEEYFETLRLKETIAA
ncbi:DUF4041 domain-containing protein [Microbulbifer sp. ANSA001]|uniref:DUF4041 domain-containing protein n=1 Tax=Microbulbifer sp. ANSA001 TaxID=3243358 RepID=UPI004042B320